MTCCCESQDFLMGGLYGLDGLNGLMGALAPGSRVRVGFAYNYNYGYDPNETERMGADYITSALYNYLGDGVTFDGVHIAVQMPSYLDYKDGYITVSANTKTQLPGSSVFGDMVEYGIQQYLPRLVIKYRDTTLVDSVPSMARGQGRFEQPTQTAQRQQQQNQLPGAPSKCAGMSPGDWIACQLGITPTAGMAAGAIGTLVLVGGVLLAVVLLKR